jgi:hydroxylamine reductase (hybrid-cluster protein)
MISVETKDSCTIFRVTGEVTANEIIMQAVRYMAGKQTETAMWDFTQATRVKISMGEIRGIANSLKDITSDGKVRKVALVGSKSVNIGLGKLFAAFAQMAGLPNDYKVFRSLSPAEQWLADHPHDS